LREILDDGCILKDGRVVTRRGFCPVKDIILPGDLIPPAHCLTFSDLQNRSDFYEDFSAEKSYETKLNLMELIS
jgi:hypothetical protein